jgi:RNA polymerase sigma factor (sigma-70 family)
MPEHDSCAEPNLTQLLEQSEQFAPALYAWARLRIRSSGNPALQAEDIVQETWLRAISARDSSAPCSRANARGWIFGIAQNVLLEQARQRTPRVREKRSASDPSTTAFIERVEDTMTSICTRLSRDETIARFLDYVGTLDELDRGLLVRCAFEDQSASDVARRLGIEPATAIKRWQRLRNHLRTLEFARRLGLDVLGQELS